MNNPSIKKIREDLIAQGVEESVADQIMKSIALEIVKSSINGDLRRAWFAYAMGTS